MSSEKVQYKDIGGQAVMEGVMMQSPSDESIAIAVRRPTLKLHLIILLHLCPAIRHFF